MLHWGFPGGSAVKNLPANAGDADLTPESGRPLKKEMETHSSILAWKIPWMEAPGRLQRMENITFTKMEFEQSNPGGQLYRRYVTVTEGQGGQLYRSYATVT